jgi:hypothetical protein
VAGGGYHGDVIEQTIYPQKIISKILKIKRKGSTGREKFCPVLSASIAVLVRVLVKRKRRKYGVTFKD